MSTPAFPFEETRKIGTVSRVEAASAVVNLPRAGERSAALHHGDLVRGGEVSEFVTIDSGGTAVFGRIVKTRIPASERLDLEERDPPRSAVHPIGEVQLLASIDLPSWSVTPGISEYPRIGSSVYSASAELIGWVVTMVNRKASADDRITVDIGTVEAAGRTPIVVTPEQLFGRHCAIVGATGGGKSWTLARIIEQVAQYKSKAILLDPSGEFRSLGDRTRHIVVGSNDDGPDISVPYRRFAETDLFALFSPAAQTQAPKLREAMQSLRLAQLLGADHGLVDSDGRIPKEGTKKADFLEACRDHRDALAQPEADFNVTLLARQIELECVFPSGDYGNDHSVWGGPAERDLTNCISLIYRIETVVTSPELEPVFGLTDADSVFDEIDDFLGSVDASILRISLEKVPFQFSARELVANAIARYLLNLARDGHFKDDSCVIFVDEAHHFLSKTIGDDFAVFPLDAFELIAKEGRKFGLTITLATQRPRDVPEGVLSQMGTLVVHRLINHDDRRIIERASGELDRAASAFLPTLGPGDAIVIGVAFPIPLPVAVAPPSSEPESIGPRYQEHWDAL